MDAEKMISHETVMRLTLAEFLRANEGDVSEDEFVSAMMKNSHGRLLPSRVRELYAMLYSR